MIKFGQIMLVWYTALGWLLGVKVVAVDLSHGDLSLVDKNIRQAAR
ncbi:hypothetical protein [Moraxella cuniculi]|nr:hypothetical protein [Moraxella cuniculi]